jgi:hypothetical protein
MPLMYDKMPISITEARAERNAANGGKIWTPRDALVHMLRMIDCGEVSPDSLILLYRTHNDTGTRVSYLRAAPDQETSLGICMEGMNVMMNASRR